MAGLALRFSATIVARVASSDAPTST